jgi:hypothetical protein
VLADPPRIAGPGLLCASPLKAADDASVAMTEEEEDNDEARSTSCSWKVHRPVRGEAPVLKTTHTLQAADMHAGNRSGPSRPTSYHDVLADAREGRSRPRRRVSRVPTVHGHGGDEERGRRGSDAPHASVTVHSQEVESARVTSERRPVIRQGAAAGSAGHVPVAAAGWANDTHSFVGTFPERVPGSAWG